LKVIVDTCVWSLSLRRRDTNRMNALDKQMLAQLREAIRDGLATIIGPVRQEILSGIRDRAHFIKTVGLLDPFLDEEVMSNDYVEAARLYNLCQDHGVQCGPVDILICAVAARNQYGILTSDQGLQRCVQLLQSKALLL
jgi:hypothetical protein